MLAYLSLRILDLFYDLRFLSLSYSENVFRIEIMIFLACERSCIAFKDKRHPEIVRVNFAGYDISGKFWDLTEHPLQQDFGLAPLNIIHLSPSAKSPGS